MKKILILGSAGMLGHVVYKYFDSLNKYEIIDTSFPKKAFEKSVLLDVTNKSELTKLIYEEKPDIIINCIGILIGGSNENPANAIYLNSYLPHYLSKLMQETGGRLVHVSTDCVFSGKRGGYVENDFKDAEDIYGKSKGLGEVINDNDLTIRTSIIGPELNPNGVGLMHWFFKQHGEIFGFEKTIWSGVTTLQLAKAIDLAIDENITGLYQVTNNEKINKFDLLSLLIKTWEVNNIKVTKTEGKKSDKSFIDTRKIIEVPSYYDMLMDCRVFMIANIELYNHYEFINKI